VSTTTATQGLGVAFKDYFNDAEKKIYLRGLDLGNDKATYTLELTGVPEQDILLNCKVNIGSLGNQAAAEFNIKLLKVPL